MSSNQKEIIKELNVEKLNIVEPDGTVKMTLFNSRNIPSLIMEGEDILPGHRVNDGVSGAMFYNNEGDECGGLIYGSSKDEDGNVSMGMSLTFDQYKQDQVVQISLMENNNKQKYGISIYDRPKTHIKDTLSMVEKLKIEQELSKKQKILEELSHNNQKRLFIGKDLDGIIKSSLYDSKGKERIRIYIDNNDEPHVEVLDENENVIRKLL
jgi:hypothetical protein